jgi:hypothetical protein
MAYDNGEHGTAQRYLIQSLRLAEESGNAALGAHVLAGMADQATLMGEPIEGRRLAQAGRAGLGGETSPACLADLWALEARALAKLGDKSGAARAVVQSEAAYSRVRLDDEQEWAAFIDPAYLHGEYANTFRDLGEALTAEEHARQSIDHARQQRRDVTGCTGRLTLAAAQPGSRSRGRGVDAETVASGQEFSMRRSGTGLAASYAAVREPPARGRLQREGSRAGRRGIDAADGERRFAHGLLLWAGRIPLRVASLVTASSLLSHS